MRALHEGEKGSNFFIPLVSGKEFNYKELEKFVSFNIFRFNINIVALFIYLFISWSNFETLLIMMMRRELDRARKFITTLVIFQVTIFFKIKILYLKLCQKYFSNNRNKLIFNILCRQTWAKLFLFIIWFRIPLIIY